MPLNQQNQNTCSLAPEANMGPLTQSSGTNDGASAFTKSSSSSSRGRKRPAVVHSSRASPRKRKQRRQSPYISWDEYNGPATSDDVEFAEDDAAAGGDAPRNRLDPSAPPMPSVEDVTDEEFASSSTDKARMHLTEAAFELVKNTPAASLRSTPRGTPAREPTETRSTMAPLTDKTAPAVIVESEHKRQDESAHAASAMQKGKGPSQTPQVEITYQIITWYPEHLSRPWIPKGSFRSKTLSELQEEIPVNLGDSHVTGLQFLVKAPGINAEYHVPNGRDEKFSRMKANLELAIRNGIAKAVKDGRPLLDIEITMEVLTDMDSTNRLDDLDFEW
ncbi:hypothetical protein CDEST_00125 [Colletotrichum destructivum]|uniref:Uncharacterized protein n=1 Tax=Colletotrichum destructivum TaxID=34406 RepID=A0AAX4HVE4_9PEZI|nr:hypothetical protein CDEST_00125 [Colletotrichum destructivum]